MRNIGSPAGADAAAVGTLREPQSCEIRELSLSRRRDRELFIRLPFRLAGSVAPWQPGIRMYFRDLLHPEKNPFWRDRKAWFFAAMRGGEIVGRMGLLDIGSIPERPHGAVFVMPDFIEDPHVLRQLLDVVNARAGACGARELIGPLNPSIHYDVGVQASGFEQPNAIFMGYQPPYYARYFEAEGFRAIAEFDVFTLYEDDFLREGRLYELARRVARNPSFQIRCADLRRFDRELEIFHRLYSDSFADHWGFVRPSWDEFKFMAGDLRLLLKPTMALIAEWEGEPVGFALGVPDLYAILPKRSRGRITPAFLLRTLIRYRRLDQVRVMIAGVLPTHRRFGIHLPLFYRIACEIFDLGFRGGEISWVMRGNEPMTKALTLLGARPAKTYRLYVRPIR